MTNVPILLTSVDQSDEILAEMRKRQSRNRLIGGSIGLLMFSYVQYLRVQTTPDYLHYSASRFMSRRVGTLANETIPSFMREFLFNRYINFYGVDKEEIKKELKEFDSFEEFFMREVKERPIDKDVHSILSPADAEIVSLEEVVHDKQELMNIKDCNYSLGELVTGIRYRVLMKNDIHKAKRNNEVDEDGNAKTKLMEMTFYLSPKDYHRFHSPHDISVENQFHIYGHLFPVKKGYISKHPDVYGRNERVCLLGSYKGGFMMMAFVGALNVGSIQLNHDESLVTNTNEGLTKDEEYEDDKVQISKKPMWEKKVFKSMVELKKGQEVGAFRLGSSIVMLVEVDRNAQVLIKTGDSVKYGQPIIINK